MESDSTTLFPEDVCAAIGQPVGHLFRFISIDGGHDEATVLSDLILAEDLLATGGIIALDDWAPHGNKQWPEVADAEVKFQVLNEDRLFHIGAIPNKLLLTNSSLWVMEYQKVLRDIAREMQ